jgi:hypothetical protein
MKKLELKLLTLCDFAMVSQEGKLSVIGMFDRIFTKKIPSSFVRSFVVAIVEGEPNNEYEIEFNIQGADGKSILPSKTLKIKLGNSGRSNLITDLVNMPLPNFGEYTLSLRSESKPLGAMIFWVNRLGGQDGKRENKPAN